MVETRIVPGAIATFARPDIGPAAPATVAATNAVPPRRPAVNFVELPARGATEPRVGGTTDHVAGAVTALPNASARVDAKRRERPGVSFDAAGTTTTFAGAPGCTVSTCVIVVATAAVAVIVGLPATVSR